jgi:hypothetical protein
MQSVAADGIKHGDITLEQPERGGFYTEPQSLLVAQSSPDACGIVFEAIVVQHSYKTHFDVSQPVAGVEQISIVIGIQRNSHGINREITA